VDRGFVRKRAVGLLSVAAAAALAGVLPAAAGTGGGGSFVGGLHKVTTVASTVPANGDVNPYGVAIVPRNHGHLTAGDVLVSNFNNAPTTAAPTGEQGRGTTIVEVSPSGHHRLFATIPATSVPGGVGLTTALVALRSGWVIVGSLPTADGTSATMKPGELFVLDSWGHVREVIRGYGIDGPWDATALDLGSVADLFVSNVLNGIKNGQPGTTTKGNVVRLTLKLTGSEPKVIASTVIANGISVKTDPAALVIGPTGVALSPSGTLFVTDTVNSRIARIPNAVFRSHPVNAGAASATVSAGLPLNGPLGLVLAPNGDLLTVNAADNNLVELTQSGKVVAVKDVDTADPPGGALFGLAATAYPHQVYFVNDDTNTLNVLR
jgi:sugar lactone lactonase YvrE